MADIHAHVGRVIHRDGAGAAAIGTVLDIARNRRGILGVTELFTPDIVAALRQTHEWTRASDERSSRG